VENIEFENNKLVFYLNKHTNDGWNNLLTSGQYSHTSSMSYDTHSFSYEYNFNRKCTSFSIFLRNQDENLIRNLILNFKSWLPIVISKYNLNENAKRATGCNRVSRKRNSGQTN
jgi:predicted transcriptional regulator YheO